MTEYKVFTNFGTFYVMADKWSVSKDKKLVLFWEGKRITNSFQVHDLMTPDDPEGSVTIA